MNWDKCEKEFVKVVEVDTERIASMVEQAEHRLQYVKERELNEKHISFTVEGYYEVIKELLVAYLLQNGLKSKNHQCLISFFYKQNPDLEAEAHLISQMSYYRNRLAYYGERIPLLFYEKNKEKFEKLIVLVKNLIK